MTNTSIKKYPYCVVCGYVVRGTNAADESAEKDYCPRCGDNGVVVGFADDQQD